MKIKSAIPIFMLFILSFPILGQEKIFTFDQNTPKQSKGFVITNFTYFYADSTNQLRFEDLSKPEFFSKMKIYDWQNQEWQGLNITYWYKTTIVNQGNLQVNFAYELYSLGEKHFYIISKKGIIQKKNGQDMPLKDRTWDINPNAVLVELALHDTLTIFTRINNPRGRVVVEDIWLGEIIPYYEDYIDISFPQLFFQGAMLIMFFYNLLLFVIVRDRAYLFYALYMLSVILYSAYRLLPNYSLTAIYPSLGNLFNISLIFITFLYVLFIRYFLNIPKIAPKTDKYLSYWTVGRVIVIILFFVSIHTLTIFVIPYLIVLLRIILLTDLILGFVLIKKSWKNNYRLTLFMIFGFLALALPILLSTLAMLVATAGFGLLALQVGILLEIVLFSLGLGYRSNLSEKEKLKVQKDFILELEKNDTLVKEQNVVLEQKVTERTEELNSTLQTVEKQRDNIISSINYALRIQNAIIPKEQEIQKYFPESFVLFRPKDIVSGDFYWLADKDEKKIIVVADCTGYGVSGAFMTMIGNNILNQIVHDQDITQPDEILNLMTPLLEKALLHSEGKVRDGMDISIVVIEQNLSGLRDLTGLKISYAGAMNPLYYVQNQEFVEIKADKVPIGGKQKEGFTYQKHSLNLSGLQDLTDLTVYLCTDGFQDQFGGTEKRKFMVSKFKKLLFEISEKPMAEQKQILETTISNWISEGNEKQTDDICVLGIRI